MPNEELVKWKRKAEDARAWDRDSATYQDAPDYLARIGISLLLLFIIGFFVVVPFIGLLTGILDFRW
jgi:hypothetical protein